MSRLRLVVGLAVVGVIGLGVVDGGQVSRGPAIAEARTRVSDPNAAVLAATYAPVGDEPNSVSTAQALACPANMLEVDGEYCPVLEQICEEYLSEKRDRCAKFRPSSRCLLPTVRKNYCIDRFEYPNQANVKPTVGVNFEEAAQICAAEGKRLCTAEEWTLACEGNERTPYPSAFERDPSACNYDRDYIMPDDAAYQNPATRHAEIARLSQSEPSGSRERCKSTYGVFDMTGNVDEWVVNGAGSVNGPEYSSGLKGGYWGPVRNRCRPMTTDHNHWHHGYQIGFRCCANVGHSPQTPSNPPRSRVNEAEPAGAAVNSFNLPRS